MATVIITDTTDGNFVGFEFDSENDVIELPNGAKIQVEKVIPMPDGYRFYNPNYIIEAVLTNG